MQYSIQASNQPRFKFTEEALNVQLVNIEESKSNTSEASSLVTEEDTSGNPLPPEIIEIRKRNKKLQKDLTNGMMNFKSASREGQDEKEKPKNKQKSNNSPISEHNKAKKNKVIEEACIGICKKEITAEEYGESKSKQDISQIILSNDALKSILDKILVLQNDFDQAKSKLMRNEQEINEKEEEFYSLKKSLQSVEEEIQDKGRIIGCNCSIF